MATFRQAARHYVEDRSVIVGREGHKVCLIYSGPGGIEIVHEFTDARFTEQSLELYDQRGRHPTRVATIEGPPAWGDVTEWLRENVSEEQSQLATSYGGR